MSNFDQTLVLIKPDALKNSLTGYIFSTLSEFHTGLRFAGAKIVHVTSMLAEEHYSEHHGKPFFPSLIEYVTGQIHFKNEPENQRVIAIVYMGRNAVKKVREISGPTNPEKAREEKPGCIRALGTVHLIKNEKGEITGDRMDNLIHASASDEEAEREIKMWFKPNDIPPSMHAYETRQSEQHFYYKNGKLSENYLPQSVCILAPGDIAWKSDLEGLQKIANNQPSSITLQAIIAKYLVNENRNEM
ncbi:MAG: nucleoside-diphosphate kinase [Fibrobacter sp.]|nr:nucleoside-diphosphate kinase [Fibrobacter sp.]